ncbi:MAG TPA: DegT/DnrJ/EryC1/StrS family aminotransferase [Puia sp.]|nr:DegT/DnrJ/EryC1/StrS family aminotransferase [Puia sp.]
MPGFELFGAEERKEVNDVLETGILMRYGFDGPRKGIWKARQLEAEIGQKLGCRHTHLVSSGTAALTTAFAVLGIGAGDEVIMPVFTFVASVESILSVGAVPVMVDVDETLTLDPEAVRRAITPRTKCVMPVHMCGAMADLEPLLRICREHDLILLEDACQSFGGSYKGKALGTIGHAGTYSFDFVKIVTCAEGGAIVTNDDGVYEKLDAFADHGHDHKGVDRGADLHPYIGYNYRISELHAAVGLAQVRKLDQFLAIQRRNQQQLQTILAAIPQVGFRRVPDPQGDICSFLSWFLPTEAVTRAVVAELKQLNILAGNFYWYDNNWHYIRRWDHIKTAASLYPLTEPQEKALHGLAGRTFAASDAIMSRCISTAVGLLWTEEQTKEKGEKIAAVIRKILAKEKVPA